MHVNEGENKLRKMTVLFFFKGYKNDNTRCLSMTKNVLTFKINIISSRTVLKGCSTICLGVCLS